MSSSWLVQQRAERVGRERSETKTKRFELVLERKEICWTMREIFSQVQFLTSATLATNLVSFFVSFSVTSLPLCNPFFAALSLLSTEHLAELSFIYELSLIEIEISLIEN